MFILFAEDYGLNTIPYTYETFQNLCLHLKDTNELDCIYHYAVAFNNNYNNANLKKDVI